MFDKNECLGFIALLFMPKICPVKYMIGVVCIFSSSWEWEIVSFLFYFRLMNIWFTHLTPTDNKPELIQCFRPTHQGLNRCAPLMSSASAVRVCRSKRALWGHYDKAQDVGINRTAEVSINLLFTMFPLLPTCEAVELYISSVGTFHKHSICYGLALCNSRNQESWCIFSHIFVILFITVGLIAF